MDRWAGWRGRGGQGIAPGGSPPVRFGLSEAVRWKSAIPGQGNSSPVVWGDRVFLTTASDDGDPPRLSVLCLNAEDGRLLWKAEAGVAKGPTHAKNGYASASVVTDGSRVVCFFGSSGLSCYDFDGRLLWHADLGDLSHQWGTAASPVLDGDRVIQLCDGGKNSSLASFDLASGKQLWRTPRPSEICWSTPVIVAATTPQGARNELVVNGTCPADGEGYVIAYQPEDGRELWRVRGTKELVTPTPVLAGDLLICASGRNGPIIAIRPGGSGDVTESRVVWKLHRGGPYIPSGVVYRNRLYLISDSGVVACYNPGNGREIWQGRVRGPVTSSLVAADGRLYAANERGQVFVLAAGDAFELLAANDLQEACFATPAVVGDQLFIRTRQHLHCFASRR